MTVDLPHASFTLENGLHVIVHEDHTLPLASVNVWYHVGSKNEQVGRTGFAHLFEHLMFEGSAHVPPGAFDDLLESVGGVNNGSTSPDRTNYWETVPSNALELPLWLEADRMGWLLESISQEKLDLQRSVVKNERRQSYENRPYGLAYERILEALYPERHPYRWPTIGSMADLEAATLDDVRSFFRTYYAPGNASLSVAGDVTVDQVRGLAERYFGEIPAGPAVPPVRAPEPTLAEDHRLTLEDDVRLPRLYLAWHSPGLFQEGDAAMDALGDILADGKASRLYRRLVHEERIAQDVSAVQRSLELSGVFVIAATARPDVSLDRIERLIRKELEELLSKGVRARELERVVNGIRSEFVRSLERVGGFGGKADRLNRYHVYRGHSEYVRDDLERFERLTPERVTAQAREVVSGSGAVALSVVPAGTTALGTSSSPV